MSKRLAPKERLPI